MAGAVVAVTANAAGNTDAGECIMASIMVVPLARGFLWHSGSASSHGTSSSMGVTMPS